MFVTRSIDKFSYRISTQGIILVVDSRACDKNIDYFRAMRTETKVYKSEILYAIWGAVWKKLFVLWTMFFELI